MRHGPRSVAPYPPETPATTGRCPPEPAATLWDQWSLPLGIIRFVPPLIEPVLLQVRVRASGVSLPETREVIDLTPDCEGPR